MSTSTFPACTCGLPEAECRFRPSSTKCGAAKRLGCLAALVFLLCGASNAEEADFLSAGPLFHEFYQTLVPGQRMEAAGPLFYKEQRETKKTWAIPPLISYTTDAAVGLN